MGGAGRFWKNWKKQKTPLPELSTLVIWPRYDLQLNYSIGGNFDIHPPTFSMDGRFPFYHAPGSFPSQNFRHFDHTLAGPIIDHAGPSGILLNRSDSPASVVGESDSPTSSRLAEGLALKRKKNNTTNGRYKQWKGLTDFTRSFFEGTTSYDVLTRLSSCQIRIFIWLIPIALLSRNKLNVKNK